MVVVVVPCIAAMSLASDSARTGLLMVESGWPWVASSRVLVLFFLVGGGLVARLGWGETVADHGLLPAASDTTQADAETRAVSHGGHTLRSTRQGKQKEGRDETANLGESARMARDEDVSRKPRD